MHRHPHDSRHERPTSVVVSLLGGFAVTVDGVTTSPRCWTRRSAAALVKVLALAAGHRLHREQVIDLLWPNEPPERTAAKLHKATHFARRAAGRHDAIVVRGDVLQLFPNADLTVDVDRFEQLARVALFERDPEAAREALAWYSGDLLPDDPYEDWAMDRRELLHLRRLDLLRAAGQWRELATIDPTDEEARTELMRCQLAAGDAAAALREYEHLERALERDLGIGTTSRVGSLLAELAQLVRRQEAVLAELAAHGVAPGRSVAGAAA